MLDKFDEDTTPLNKQIVEIEKQYDFTFPKPYFSLKNDEIFTLLAPQKIIELMDEIQDDTNLRNIIPFAVQYDDLEGADAYYFFVKDKPMVLNNDFEIVANDCQEFIFFNLLQFMYRKQNHISIDEFKESVNKLIQRYENELNKQQQQIISQFHKREVFSHAPIKDMPKALWFTGLLTKQELDSIVMMANTVYKP